MDIIIDAGTLTASREDRIVTGLLLPYGEDCRSNLGTFSVDAGAFTIPADVPGTVGFNVEHRREASVGRGVTMLDTPQGVVASFSIARTPEGDAVLDDIASGARRHLSVEAADIKIKDGKAVAGRIFGASVVAQPAFPSATLLASAPDTEEEPPEPIEPEVTEETEEPDEEPDETEEESDMSDVATAPDTLHAARVAAPARDVVDLRRFSTLLAQRRFNPEVEGTLRDIASYGGERNLFAALSDITVGGTPGPGVATGVMLPQYIGELWHGVAYQRRIVPLLSSAPLTSLTINGWKWVTSPAVAPWAGNKAAVPSPAVQTTPTQLVAKRLAGAYDVGREFVDFDVPGFWESFWQALTASYAKQSDDVALSDLAAGATKLAAGAAPAGVATGVHLIVAAATAILSYGTPAFAVISPELFTGIATITNAGSFPYLNVSNATYPVFGPNVTVAGIPVIPGAVGTGTALVAAREAATFYELPGAPIRVEGLDVSRGGIDPGLFGYYATGINQPLAVVHAGVTAPALADADAASKK